MSFLLTVVGALLFAVTVAGFLLSLLVATRPKTRRYGYLFALWWIPAAAAASGILMRDPVTFVVGGICFVVAGPMLLLERRRVRKVAAQSRKREARRSSGYT